MLGDCSWNEFNGDDVTAEKKLLRAILYRAASDFTTVFLTDIRDDTLSSCERIRERSNLQREAEGWIEDRSISPWSYRWVCCHLDLDPEILRRELWRARRYRETNGPQQRIGKVKW